MKVRIKLLGGISSLTGVKTVEIQVNKDDTVGKSIEKMVRIYGEQLKRRIFYKGGGLGVILLLNGKGCDLGDKVKDGDEIFIMPPISGG